MRLLLVGIFLLVSAPAQAQESEPVFRAEDRSRFVAYLQSEEIAAARLDYAMSVRTARFPECTEMPVLQVDRYWRRVYWFDEEARRYIFQKGIPGPLMPCGTKSTN